MVLANISAGPWRVVSAEIDLGPSAGRLIFDTVTDGAGTNVAQPFRAGGGGARLAVEPRIPDGATSMTLDFADFAPGAGFSFTIDLDDRLTARAGPTIAGAEIAGAVYTVVFAHEDGGTETHAGAFDDRGDARAAAPCIG